jgi:hypothetical protein
MKNKVTPSESMKSFLKNKFVLVHLCYYNKISHTGQLINKRIFFLPVLEPGKSKIKVSTHLVSSEGQSLCSKMELL